MNEARDGRKVYCVVTDKAGNSVQTETVTLTLSNGPRIVSQPKNASAGKGKEVRTEVKAEGEKLTYAWYYLDKGAKEFKVSSKCTENYYTAEMNEARDGRKVYCVVTDQDGNSVQTETVTLTLSVGPRIVTQPKDASAENGKEARTEVKAEGGKLTYAWYYLDKGAKEFKVSSKCTENYYTAEMNEARDGRQVYCVVTDENGSVQTKTVTLTLKKSVQQPAQQDTVLGHWDDGFKLLDVYEDGRMELTYKSDGYVSKMEWTMVKGVPTITKGIWKDIPMTLENGLLIITRDSLYQEFARVGDAPSENVNGGQEDAFDEEAEANDLIAYVPGTMDDFIGGWICADDENIQLLLLENEANLIDPDDGCMTVDWEIVNGVAEFNGMKLYIQEDWSGVLDMGGELVMFNRGYVEKPDDGFAFDMTGDDEMTDEEALIALLELLAAMEEEENGNQSEFNYLDTDFVLSGAYNAFTAIDHTMYGEYKVKFLSNGKAEFVQGGQALAPDYLSWAINEEGAYVLSYTMMGVTYLTYTFVPDGEALNMDFYGTTMIFTPVK